MHDDLYTSTVEMYEESNEDENAELTGLAKSLVAHWLEPPGVSDGHLGFKPPTLNY